LKNLRRRWHRSSIARCLGVLSSQDQKKIIAVTLIQVCMGALDLLGVAAIGLLGALSVTGLQSRPPGDRINSVLQILHVSELSFQSQAVIIGSLAVFLLISRTLLSIFFTRRVLFFLSRRGAMISSNLISRLLSQSLLFVHSRTTQETLFAVTNGVGIITLQILATYVVLISDFALLLIMAIGLLLIDPITSIIIFVIFSGVGLSLYFMLHVRAGKLGFENSLLSIKSNEKIVEVFATYRESVVRNRRDFYAREIGKLRFKLADLSAETAFMPYISKYVIETSVVLGALMIGALQFILQDTAQAVATLSIFLAAGTRIAPAVLRIQQGLLAIRGSIGQATPTLDLIYSLGTATIIENVDDTLDTVHVGFKPEISLLDLSFVYPDKSIPAISNVSLKIPPGTSVAFVGPSGAGKTTLIDILLGVLKPDLGSVEISGLPPIQAVAKWPGAVSYVPQDVVIVAGTIRENVALGFPAELATDKLVTRALKVANLDEFVNDLPNGLDTQVGERGTSISGGQRQRLGIARAMFTQPSVLVLDEATSSLDGDIEANISDAIHALQGLTTVIMIAHRLSTVRNANIVVYLAEGKIKAHGTFEEVRDKVPDFDRQAKLMGL
jgi:ABC-type multidrug transport system fused ATPase/permease subunit